MRLERSCKKLYHQSWFWYIWHSGAAGFLASFFHWKWNAEDFRKNILFSCPLQALPIKCTPASVCEPSWCWTLILLDTRQNAQLNPHFPPLRGLLWLSAHCHFPAFLSWPMEAASRAATVHAQEIYFFFNLCILITRPPFQKTGCFEIMKSFHRSCCFLFLWIPLLTESYRFPEGNCLDFFIASICSHQSHWQTFCLFFRDTKTKPNAIRQRSAHLLNHEQGLGSLVK